VSAAAATRLGVVALLLAGSGSLRAQPADRDDAPGLDRAVERVAGAWSDGDLAALHELLDAAGVRFRDAAGEHGRLDPRKARAVVRRLWSEHRGGRVLVERSAVVGGSPTRGFAHLRWRTVPEGTSEPVSYTLFVGMVHGPAGWRIYELRVLR